jgi:hypothetical protein
LGFRTWAPPAQDAAGIGFCTSRTVAGRAGHLTTEERQAIRPAFLEHGGRLTRKTLAARQSQASAGEPAGKSTISSANTGMRFMDLIVDRNAVAAALITRQPAR